MGRGARDEEEQEGSVGAAEEEEQEGSGGTVNRMDGLTEKWLVGGFMQDTRV